MSKKGNQPKLELTGRDGRSDPVTGEVLETETERPPLPRGSGRITTESGSKPKKGGE